MALFDLIRSVQEAAKAEQDGDSTAHLRLLNAIHRLNLVAETPGETATRLRFQVCGSKHVLSQRSLEGAEAGRARM